MQVFERYTYQLSFFVSESCNDTRTPPLKRTFFSVTSYALGLLQQFPVTERSKFFEPLHPFLDLSFMKTMYPLNPLN